MQFDLAAQSPIAVLQGGQISGDIYGYILLLASSGFIIACLAGVYALVYSIHFIPVVIFHDLFSNHALARTINKVLVPLQISAMVLGILVTILIGEVPSNYYSSGSIVERLQALLYQHFAIPVKTVFISISQAIFSPSFNIWNLLKNGLLPLAILVPSIFLTIDRTYLVNVFKNQNEQDFWWRSNIFYWMNIMVAFIYGSRIVYDEEQANGNFTLVDDVLALFSMILVVEPSIFAYIDSVETV
ncbi:hypothetical protein FGO68_gene2667 [Halteria grandinella]|uniref:Uncharacterized protein n=1 Tax=Halteria grandinella TaxID=5974 RepID=A0A8J8NKL9_HALGN|nr:hypothetical protein FGO68_gene2667 [Halteria grandinella]